MAIDEIPPTTSPLICIIGIAIFLSHFYTYHERMHARTHIRGRSPNAEIRHSNEVWGEAHMNLTAIHTYIYTRIYILATQKILISSPPLKDLTLHLLRASPSSRTAYTCRRTLSWPAPSHDGLRWPHHGVQSHLHARGRGDR